MTIHFFVATAINMLIYTLTIWGCSSLSRLFGSDGEISLMVIVGGIISSPILAFYSTKKHFKKETI